MELQKYVGKDSNLNTIAALLRALGKSLKESYIDEATTEKLYRYIFVLIMPLKATFGVPLAALEVLETRIELFQEKVMEDPKKIF